MTEYYGYVKRGLDTQVDWGAISKGLTDDINKIASDRESKKSELDKMNQDLVNSANQLEMTDNEYVNSLVMGAANQAKELSLMNNSLLKKGVLKPSDYTTSLENMKLGVSDLSKAIKGFAPAYQKSMERLSKGQMSELEKAEKQELFEYGNLKNKTIYLHNNGSYYITDKDENGNPVTDPNKMVSAGRLASLVGQERAVVDIPAEVEKGAKKFLEIEKFVGSGGVLSSSSARNNEPNYKKAKGDFVESVISTDESIVAVLSDYLGKYKVGKRGEKGEGIIERDANGKLLITDSQKKEAREVVDSLFESMIKETIKEMPIERASSGSSTPKDNTDGVISLNLKRLIQGNSEEISTAISYFRSQNPDIKNVVKTKDSFDITTKDDELIQIPTSGDPTLIANKLIGWLSPGKVANPDKIISKLGITSVSTSEGSFQSSKKFIETGDIEVLNKKGEFVTFRNFLSEKEPDEADASKINKALSDIDPKITVKASGDRFSPQDKISIFYAGNFVEEINYDDQGDENKLIEVIDKIRKGESTSAPIPTSASESNTGKPNLNASTRNK
jgi:hypothetical protein